MCQRSKTTILIVDDNRDFADSLFALLSGYGYEVKVAYDTATGFKLAKELVPDVILHDIGLPMINGYDAARYLRSQQEFAKTTLVAVTAYNAPHDRKRARLAGFDVHMSKPINFEDLNRLLDRPPRQKMA